jgi:hypothetical protein
MSYDNLSSVSQNVLKFYQQLTGEETRITAIKVLFLHFNLCLSVMLDKISCSFTSTSFLTKIQVIFIPLFSKFQNILRNTTQVIIGFLHDVV